jgi:hypothetical protein
MSNDYDFTDHPPIPVLYEYALKDCKQLEELKSLLEDSKAVADAANHTFYWYKTHVNTVSDFLDFIRSSHVINNGITFGIVTFGRIDEDEAQMEFECNLRLDDLVSIMKRVDDEDLSLMISHLNYRADFDGESIDGRLDDD